MRFRRMEKNIQWNIRNLTKAMGRQTLYSDIGCSQGIAL